MDIDIDMNSIGRRINNRRKELNLTQTDIKHNCGISSGNLSEIENGNRAPSTLTLYRLSTVLNCSIDWIVTGKSSDKKNLFISDIEENLLCGFRMLKAEDQNELMEIMQLKLRRVKGASNEMVGSSNLDSTRKNSHVG